jgi:hypothetical protein
MFEMAQGNVSFCKEPERGDSSQRALGIAGVFDDVESGARQAGGIFLAEDDPERLGEVAVRIAELAYKPPVLVIVTIVPGVAS